MPGARKTTLALAATDDLASLEIAYRKARWTIIGHGIFFFICCAIAVIARRMIKMPPALLTVVGCALIFNY